MACELRGTEGRTVCGGFKPFSNQLFWAIAFDFENAGLKRTLRDPYAGDLLVEEPAFESVTYLRSRGSSAMPKASYGIAMHMQFRDRLGLKENFM